jgi:hypothetical protein
MTEPAPPASEPEDSGLPARLRKWLDEHVEPGFSDVKADVAKLLAHAGKFTGNLSSLADIVLTVAKAADPAAAPEVAAAVAEAERVAAELKGLAGKFTGNG